MYKHPPGGDFDSILDSQKLICIDNSSSCPFFLNKFFTKVEKELLENTWIINNLWTLSSYCNTTMSTDKRIKGIIICHEDRVFKKNSSESAILVRDIQYHFKSYKFIDDYGYDNFISVRILYK